VVYFNRIIHHHEQDGQLLRNGHSEEAGMKMMRVEFDAHKKVKRPTRVAFERKGGEKVCFTAEKPTKVPIRDSFRARASSR
jgi:hypothetical protein